MSAPDDLGLDGGDTETGFLDVAANALAIVILATLFVIILSAQPPVSGDVPADGDPPDLAMPSRLDTSFPPLSLYYFVFEEGIVAFDVDALALKAASGETAATTDQARLSFQTPRISRRDYDEYKAIITPDYGALRAAAESLETPAAVTRLVDDMEKRYAEAAFVPTFLVLPRGTGTFAPIYHGLRDRGLPLRWYTFAEGGNVILANKADDYQTRARRW